MKLRLTIDFNLEVVEEDEDVEDEEYPIVGDHEGEHIVFTPEQC